jgi:hypothetical protein
VAAQAVDHPVNPVLIADFCGNSGEQQRAARGSFGKLRKKESETAVRIAATAN